MSVVVQQLTEWQSWQSDKKKQKKYCVLSSRSTGSASTDSMLLRELHPMFSEDLEDHTSADDRLLPDRLRHRVSVLLLNGSKQSLQAHTELPDGVTSVKMNWTSDKVLSTISHPGIAEFDERGQNATCVVSVREKATGVPYGCHIFLAEAKGTSWSEWKRKGMFESRSVLCREKWKSSGPQCVLLALREKLFKRFRSSHVRVAPPSFRKCVGIFARVCVDVKERFAASCSRPCPRIEVESKTREGCRSVVVDKPSAGVPTTRASCNVVLAREVTCSNHLTSLSHFSNKPQQLTTMRMYKRCIHIGHDG